MNLTDIQKKLLCRWLRCYCLKGSIELSTAEQMLGMEPHTIMNYGGLRESYNYKSIGLYVKNIEKLFNVNISVILKEEERKYYAGK